MDQFLFLFYEFMEAEDTSTLLQDDMTHDRQT